MRKFGYVLVRHAALVKLSSNRRPRGVVPRKRAKAARIPRVPGELRKLVTPCPKPQSHEADQYQWREMRLPRELRVRRCIARSIHPLRECSVAAQRIPQCCRMGEISGDLRRPLWLRPLKLPVALLAWPTQSWQPMQSLSPRETRASDQCAPLCRRARPLREWRQVDLPIGAHQRPLSVAPGWPAPRVRNHPNRLARAAPVDAPPVAPKKDRLKDAYRWFRYRLRDRTICGLEPQSPETIAHPRIGFSGQGCFVLGGESPRCFRPCRRFQSSAGISHSRQFPHRESRVFEKTEGWNPSRKVADNAV